MFKVFDSGLGEVDNEEYSLKEFMLVLGGDLKDQKRKIDEKKG